MVHSLRLPFVLVCFFIWVTVFAFIPESGANCKVGQVDCLMTDTLDFHLACKESYTGSGTIFGDSSNYDSASDDSSNDDSSNDDRYTADSSSAGLSVAVITGIVIGSIVLAAIVVTFCVAFIYGCSKTGQGGSVVTPVQAVPVQMVSTGVTPMTHPTPYSQTVNTGHAVYNQSLPGAVSTGDTEC